MRLFVFMELSRSAAGIKDARQSSPIVGEGSTASACVRDARTTSRPVSRPCRSRADE